MPLVQRKMVQLVHKGVSGGKILPSSRLQVQVQGKEGGSSLFLPPPTLPTVPCPRNPAPGLGQWVLRCHGPTGCTAVVGAARDEVSDLQPASRSLLSFLCNEKKRSLPGRTSIMGCKRDLQRGLKML